MSKTSKNILGDQRGKIGKVVGRVVEGEQMYSAAPGPRGSHGTPKQHEHRARFSVIVTMGKPLKGAIRLGFKVQAATKHLQTPFNRFVTHNLNHTEYDAATGMATPTYADIVLATGEVPYVNFGTPSFAESGTVSVTFTPNSEWPGALADDTVYAVAYCPGQAQSAMGVAARTTGTLTITVPPNWSGEAVHIWGFTRTSVTEIKEIEQYGLELLPGACSRSVYIGTGTMA